MTIALNNFVNKVLPDGPKYIEMDKEFNFGEILD
jgi:hypothetical protein